MKNTFKKTLSFLLTICMLLSLFTGLSITASADAMPTLTLNVMGKDGTTAAWTENWYFKAGTSENKYLDSTFTKNADGTGGELSVLNTFNDDYFAANTKYDYFKKYDAFVYVGGRSGPTARIGVVKRGILMDDLVKYAETQSGFATLDGKTKVQMKAGSDGKIWPYTDISNCAFEDYYWGQTRYYFKGMAEAIPSSGGHGTWFSPDAMALMTDENRVEVPYVFAMVGYGGDCKSLDYALNTADTEMSLRTYMGTSTQNKTAYDGGDTDFQGNLGNPSAQNINQINFYPVYDAITVTGGTASGAEGTDGYKVAVTGATITADDNYFKESAGKSVTLTVTPDTNYKLGSFNVTKTDGGGAVATTVDGNAYTFTMPDGGVTVNAEMLSDVVALTADAENTWTVTAASDGGTTATLGASGLAAQNKTVTVTVTRNSGAEIAGLDTLTVKDGANTAIDVTEVSKQTDSNGLVYSAVYTFVKPATQATVSLTSKYAGLTVSERKLPISDASVKFAFTRAQMTAMDETDDFYYGGFNSTPEVVQGKAAVSVALTDVLNAADVEFLPGDKLTLTSADGTKKVFTYAELYGVGRYYFPALYTGTSWAARSNGKILCQPHLVITGAEAIPADGGNVETAKQSSAAAYQFAFGMTMDEFSLNSDATPANGALTATGYIKNITNITVTHAYNYDVSWYVGHENDASYTLTDEADLRGLAQIVNGTAVDRSFASVAQSDFSGKTVSLAADIALTSKWTPIGLATVVGDSATYSPKITAGNGFAGTFDGAGNTVSGLSITAAGSGIGLFGYVAPTGVIKDFTLIGSVNVSGNYDAIGAVAGYNSGTITGVRNLASVTNTDGYNVGGVAGFNDGYYMEGHIGLIENCSNEANISSNNSKVGGIAGENSGTVNACYNLGTVYSTGAKAGAGGIVGRNGNNNTAAETGVVSNCYNLTTVAGSSKWSGGIAGFNNSKSSIKNCYTTAGTAYTGSYANPIAGKQEGAANCLNNYSVTGLSATGSTEAEKGIVKTAEEMRSADFMTLLGSAFKTNSGCWPVLSWQAATGHTWDAGVVTTPATAETSGVRTYTCLICGETRTVSIPATGTTTGGVNTSGMNLATTTWDGKSVDVSWYVGHENAASYTISTAAQLAGVAAIGNGLVNTGCSVYTGSAVVSAADWNNSTYVNNATGTHGACNRSTDDYSYGVDDFNGKTLTVTADLDMSAGNYMPIGGQYLMTTNDSDTKIGSSFCGTFEGGGHSITIECNRYCSTVNYGDGESVGLIGRLGVHDDDSASIRPVNPTVCNVAIYGSVYANRSVGGVVGKIGKTSYNNGDGSIGGKIENCANFAAVSGTDAKGTGGICGAAWNGGEIRNCYNAGAINNTHNSYGGIAGSNEVSLINCYNVGTVTGIGTSAAIATENVGSTYTNCYWLNTSADMGVYNITPAGVASKTSTEMKAAAFVTTLGSAFAADTYNINNGYPVLSWQNPSAASRSGASPVSVIINSTTNVTGVEAATTVNASDVTNGIKAAADEKANTIVIKADTNGKTAASTAVSVPKSSISDIAAAGLSLTAQTADGSRVTLSPDALKSAASQATGDTLQIAVTPKTAAESKAVAEKAGVTGIDYDNSLAIQVVTKSGDKVLTNFTGDLTVELPIDTSKYTLGQTYKVVQISDNGSVNILNGTCVNMDGELYVCVTVTHLSTFIATNEKTVGYDDVALNAWYYDAAKYVTDTGLMNGTGSSKFTPQRAMTRAMLAETLYRLDGNPVAAGKITFSDVKDGSWYADAVTWAASHSIVLGDRSGAFSPNSPITREQMATILYRYAKYKGRDVSVGEDTNILSYTDALSVSEYAVPALRWACGAGVINGTSAATLTPGGPATRAQAAVILMRFCQKPVK